MTYRKFTADYLYTGEGLAGSGSVLITTTDGTVQAVVPAGDAGEDVAYFPGLLSPGFVNCHCHLELSHMRGVVPERTGLVDFLPMVIRRRGEGSKAEAIAAAEQEMLDNGIVAVGDICNTTDTLDQKRCGRLRYYNFIETMGFIERGAAARFAGSEAVFNAFEDVFPGSNAIVPHAPYSVSPALFAKIAEHAAGRVLTMHNQETEEENDFLRSGTGDFRRLFQQLGIDAGFFNGTGRRSLGSALRFFSPRQPMILVHNVVTAREDLDDVNGRPLYFCLCPNANLYISGRLPDPGLLMRYGCRLVMGTDSLASNHSLSILEELKTLQRAFPALSMPVLLQWATSNGAQALGMEGCLGFFRPDTRPGVVLISDLQDGRFSTGTKARRLV
jgi:aminodeoxyfutalosine deaminase